MQRDRFVVRHCSVRTLGLFVLLAALCAPVAGNASPGPGMPNHRQMQALYVIDHHGRNPRTDADLVAYSRSFQKILAGCPVRVDDLMMAALDLADQASEQGGREVTSLMMLKAIARRIDWTGFTPKGCGYVFDVAEAYAETGAP